MTEKNLEIEALRGVAVLLVLLAHFEATTPWEPLKAYFSLRRHFECGVGVDIFFCISGYVVAKSLLGNQAAWSLSGAHVKAFFIKRIFRILPSALFWVAAVLVLTVTFNRSSAFGRLDWNLREAWHILDYTYNFYVSRIMEQNATGVTQRQVSFGPYWTLSLEEQFYFLLPICLLLVGRRRFWKLLVTLIAVQWAFYIFSHVVPCIRADGLMLGVGLFLVQQSSPDFYRAVEPHRLRRFTVVLNVVLIVALLFLCAPPPQGGLQAVISTLAALTVWLASYGQGYGIQSRMLIWFGSRSYAIYLTHLPMFRVNIELWQRFAMAEGISLEKRIDHWIISACGLVLTLVASELNFRYLERPLTSFGRRIALRQACGDPTELGRDCRA